MGSGEISTASLADKLAHAKRESKALKAQLEASRIAYDDLPAVVDRRDLFEKTRDKYNER